MRTEDSHVPGIKVICIIFHERGASPEALCHDFHQANQRCSLPVTLCPEAVAVSHESLHSQARQLDETVKILKVGGERLEPSLLKECAHAGFYAGCLFNCRCGNHLCGSLVLIAVLLHKGADLLVCHLVYCIREISDTISLHLIIKCHLC